VFAPTFFVWVPEAVPLSSLSRDGNRREWGTGGIGEHRPALGGGQWRLVDHTRGRGTVIRRDGRQRVWFVGAATQQR